MKLDISFRSTFFLNDLTCYSDNDDDLEKTSDTSSNVLRGQFGDVGRADHGHGSNSETDGESTSQD